MRFQLMRDCRRSAAEQRFIYSALEIFPRLKEGERQEIRALIDRLAEGPAEGRALYALLVRGETMQRIGDSTGVSAARLYRLRRDFYEQFPIG